MNSQPVFPISLHVTDRRVVVVGDGEEARARATRLARCGARTTELAPGAVDSEALAGAYLVVIQLQRGSSAPEPPGPDRARTDLRSEEERLAAMARAANCRLLYVADRPDLSDFSMPGIAERGPLQLAVSTGATAPALTRRLRAELQRLLDGAGAALDLLLAELNAQRAQLPADQRASTLAQIAARARFDGALRID